MKRFLLTLVLVVSLMAPVSSMADSAAGSQAVAEQAQVQGQSQGQSASGGAVVGSGNSALKIQDSFNGSKPLRYLPIPAMYPMENYQATPYNENFREKGWNFVSMHQLIKAMNYVDLKQKVEMRKLNMNTQMLAAKGKVPAKAVTFELNDGEVINGGFKPIAVITIQADSIKDINSASLAMAAGKRAQALGAGRCIFLTEGSTSELTSSGWGIGMSYSRAGVGSDGNDMGQVGAGGTGYSRGKGKFKRYVYLTAIVGN